MLAASVLSEVNPRTCMGVALRGWSVMLACIASGVPGSWWEHAQGASGDAGVVRRRAAAQAEVVGRHGRRVRGSASGGLCEYSDSADHRYLVPWRLRPGSC